MKAMTALAVAVLVALLVLSTRVRTWKQKQYKE